MNLAYATSSSPEAVEPAEQPFLPADWPNRDCSRFVVSSGFRWHVQRMGQGPCMLLLHGTAASTHTWRDVMPLLAQRFDVIAVDLPGHGYSERLPSRSMSLDSLSGAVADLMVTLDAEPEHIVGHSAGAAIALDLVLHRGIDAATVCGINAALLPFGGVLKNLFSPMARFFATTHLMPRMLARRARNRKAVSRVLEGTGSKLDANGLSFYQRLFQDEVHMSSVIEMMAMWELQPLVERLPGLDARLLLVVGSGDRAVSPREAGKIRQLVPALDVRELDGLGHLAHEEAPQAVVDLVQQFASDSS